MGKKSKPTKGTRPEPCPVVCKNEQVFLCALIEKIGKTGGDVADVRLTILDGNEPNRCYIEGYVLDGKPPEPLRVGVDPINEEITVRLTDKHLDWSPGKLLDEVLKYNDDLDGLKELMDEVIRPMSFFDEHIDVHNGTAHVDDDRADGGRNYKRCYAYVLGNQEVVFMPKKWFRVVD